MTGSREYYRTEGFNELAYVQDESYRKATDKLNRARRETEEGGTPSRTLAHIAEKEGSKIQEAMNNTAEEILLEHNFGKDGSPKDEAVLPVENAKEEVSLPKEVVVKTIEEYNQDKEEEDRIDEEAANSLYENPQKAVNISIDEVGVKKQKEQRNITQEEECSSEDCKDKKMKVYIGNIVAHVEQEKKRYIINGSSILQIKWLSP